MCKLPTDSSGRRGAQAAVIGPPALPAAVMITAGSARRQRGHVLSLNRMLWLVRPQKASDARALFEPLEIPSIVMRHIKESVEASPMVTPLIRRLCACLQPQTPDSVLP